VLTDVGSNKHNGTYKNAAAPGDTANPPPFQLRSAKMGTGKISFPRACLTTPDAPYLRLAKTGMTLEAWLYMTGGAPFALWLKSASETYSGCDFLVQNQFNRAPELFGEAAGAHVASTAEIPLSAWSHSVITYDGTKARFYLNGALAGEPAFTANIGSSAGPLAFGAQPLFPGAGATEGEWNFTGKAAMLATYQSVLSPARVKVHYEAGIALPSITGSAHVSGGGREIVRTGRIALSRPHVSGGGIVKAGTRKLAVGAARPSGSGRARGVGRVVLPNVAHVHGGGRVRVIGGAWQSLPVFPTAAPRPGRVAATEVGEVAMTRQGGR
jgi:hypothetical protein